MSKPLIEVDPTRPAEEQREVLHNRWHPDIPAAVEVRPGDVFIVETMDWTNGQVRNDDDASDIRDMDLTHNHILTGPIAVRGAEPGDLLVVDILDIGPHPKMNWGYTGIFAKSNGGGFLTEHFPEAHKAIWDFHGIYATSRHVPGVRIPAIPHPGILGTAPSHELLAKWNERERRLIARDPHRVPPLALPPEPRNAILGRLKPGTAEFDRIAAEGARTIPPRENGGNRDIKNLTRGARAYLPVYVPGAKLTVGDLHFTQGDGEITFCGAIEMAGWIQLHVDLIKDGMNKYGIRHAMFEPSPVEPRFSRYLVFEGYSVDEYGEQHYLDAHVAYRRAVLEAVEYLKRFGYTGEEAYVILGAAPVEGRISSIVDIPNACATLWLPTEIFTFDILPKAEGPTPKIQGGRLARAH
ncbi:MAG: acetamidase/formamidase family protein [Hydrogenibacillus schlegelii]|uniref:Acetamidase/formamidase family protein n=1 Tax=Hydrogenibacillus schlegelii TaxID=1484 RepID=A0A947G877_HYDSH|nr:acetamidase/formamidase family protein [Hydrogenibacillus schlegelii]